MLIIGLAFLTAIGTTASAQDDAGKRDQFEIKVDGLGCPYCAFGLEKKFKEFKGIKDVEIDMETGIFTFSYPAETNLSLIQVEHQVDAAGYTPITAKIIRASGEIEESKEIVKQEIPEDQLSTETFWVNGKCDMCETRIERATMKLEGVASAEWKKKAKKLTVRYDKNMISLDSIQQAIALRGYDNEKFRAADEVYKALPACCRYKRKKK